MPHPKGIKSKACGTMRFKQGSVTPDAQLTHKEVKVVIRRLGQRMTLGGFAYVFTSGMTQYVKRQGLDIG